MSHLTASPFHKPSPFEFPQRTGSADTLPAHPQLPTPATTSVIGGQDPHHGAEYFDTPTGSISADPGSRFRRVASSIVYHNSGLRESRERTVQRSSRSFVVVLPPPSLPQDHGHLGHTLSSGPRHRLSQGLLMPLFPTMYGQLTAIAREYNFPSTTGLCLYLHYTDNGITVTPRISDDSWQMMWSHAFEPAPASTHASLPISGKIEFDIDMRLARWYGAWMASSHREHVDVPMSVTPSAAPSVVHFREESRTTFLDGDDQDNQFVARPPVRHIPRKLSLIDRFDAMSARSVPRSVAARPSPPEQLSGSQNLSPIFQEEEPKTAKYDLEHRVNTWRASASVLPGAIAEAGHILLAGANLPNSPLDESPMRASNDDENNDDEYRIEDYSFSISSAGPGDYDPYSPLTWYYDPSVHLANRMEGSVCMTPSVCTSFGPSDYTLPLHIPTLDLDRVRTPDIAQRMFEDVPPSPSVATSWGAPLSYPPSPINYSRAPSVHLGDRQCFTRPITPMTATSWGAPESFPPSPTTPFYVHTPDAGQRTFDLSALSDHDAPWPLVWPYHDASRPYHSEAEQSSAAPWNMVWPYLSNDAPAQGMESGRNLTAPWNMVWPYHANQTDAQATGQTPATPWNMVWPYHANQTDAQATGPSPAAPWNMVWPYHNTSAGSGPVSVTTPAVYPCLNIYPAVYPHFDLYPAASGAFTDTPTPAAKGPVTIRLAAVYPEFDLYPSGYPSNLANLYPAKSSHDSPSGISIRLSTRYPSFDLYPAVYPHIVPYPPFQYEMEAVSPPSYYPHFNLYPPIATLGHRSMTTRRERGPVSVVLRTAYPVFNLYPAIYPAFDIYPQMNGVDSVDGSAVSIRLAAVYPIFDLYPAVYPAFDLYPALPENRRVAKVLSRGYPDFNIYPAVSRQRQPPRTQDLRSEATAGHQLSQTQGHLSEAIVSAAAVSQLRQPPRIKSADSTESVGPTSVRLPASYPIFNLYPALYPTFEIYPAPPDDCSVSKERFLSQTAGYPHFNLYPPVGLYSEVSRAVAVSAGVSVRLTVAYPIFDLYPAVYPSLEIYPSLPEDCSVPVSKVVPQTSGYPHFNLYPAVGYPYFDLYPEVSRAVAANSGISVRLTVAYPIFDLYPAVYPSLEIYPSLPEDCSVSVSKERFLSQTSVSSGYPHFNLYPPVGYPYFDLYPEVSKAVDTRSRGVNVGGVARYPVFNLYPAVYPFFDLYPGAWNGPEKTELTIRVEARYPYFNLYPAIYPHFDLWPTLLSMQEPRVPKQSRFTSSDLHALVKKSPLNPQRGFREHSKSHQALHMTVFPKGADVLTPSGSTLRASCKTHRDLHLSVFPSGVEVSTPSGTGLKDGSTVSDVSPALRLSTRMRSGSVLRMSLPASPRPVGGRSPTVHGPPNIPIPAPPTNAPRRAISTATTRPSVVDRAPKAASLTRSVSMASPPSAPEPTKLDRTSSVNGPRANRRDSLVLQRVRALQMNTEPTIKEDDPLSSFPLPPRASPPRKVVS